MRRNEHIRFGAFDLDLETGELRRQDAGVKLSPKPLQLLTLLARSPGRLITRETIRAELWGKGTFVDFEHALNFCVRKLRTALGDDAKTPRFIETLPRRGYRFVAETTTRMTAQTVTPGASELEAYGYYVRARQALTQVGKEGLEQARQDFENALTLDPGYALAHSGLGAAHALRSLNRRDPDDLNAARQHLERALELDPEIAEPYPWLCYVFMRQNEIERALSAGRRAVELQPDLVHAHYFLGLAHFAAAEFEAGHMQPAVRHLLDASQVGPHWQASWFVLSYAALLSGNYERAEEFAGKLLNMNLHARGLPFIGAEIVLASVKLRRGEPAVARSLLTEFLDRLAQSDHMYRDAMSAAAACVLGDVELRHGQVADALVAFRRAWHMVQEHPRIMAYLRTAARAQSGLAAAYAATGDHKRASDLLARAIEAARKSELPEHNAAAAPLSELYWSMATACMRLGEREQAVLMLQKAVVFGWRDAHWLDADPEFAGLRGHTLFSSLREVPRLADQVQFE